jgi:uncharacterized HAD superfamily protein
MVHQLMTFYHDLFHAFKHHPPLQNIALQFLVETLLLVGGENRKSESSIVMSINEFDKVKETIKELIQ